MLKKLTAQEKFGLAGLFTVSSMAIYLGVKGDKGATSPVATAPIPTLDLPAKKKSGEVTGGVELEASFPYGKTSLPLYQYAQNKNTAIAVDVPFQALLSSNNIQALVYKETLPRMGLANDVSGPEDAVALRGLSFGNRSSAANIQILKELLGANPGSVSKATRNILENYLEAIELGVTSFDKRCPMGLGSFKGVRRQRIWANALWTAVNRASSRGGVNGLQNAAIELLSANDLPLYSGVKKQSVDFVDAFFKGVFNSEITNATDLCIFTKGSSTIPSKAIPSGTKDSQGEEILMLSRVMEPAWLDGVVFYNDSMSI